MPDFGIFMLRVTFALIGGCIGALFVSIPMSMVYDNADVHGWGLGLLLASVLVGAVVGWRTPEWSDW